MSRTLCKGVNDSIALQILAEIFLFVIVGLVLAFKLPGSLSFGVQLLDSKLASRTQLSQLTQEMRMTDYARRNHNLP